MIYQTIVIYAFISNFSLPYPHRRVRASRGELLIFRVGRDGADPIGMTPNFPNEQSGIRLIAAYGTVVVSAHYRQAVPGEARRHRQSLGRCARRIMTDGSLGLVGMVDGALVPVQRQCDAAHGPDEYLLPRFVEFHGRPLGPAEGVCALGASTADANFRLDVLSCRFHLGKRTHGIIPGIVQMNVLSRGERTTVTRKSRHP